MMTATQLNQYYGRELTPQEITAEQKLIYETDELLEGTGHKHHDRVKTKDGTGIITHSMIDSDDKLIVAVQFEIETGLRTAHYLLEELSPSN